MASTQPEPRSRWRRIAALVLVILTSIGVVVSAVGVWAHNTVLQTDNFMQTVGPVLDDPAFYDATGDYVSEQVLAALDLDTVISNALADLDAYLAAALVDALGIGERGQELLGSLDRPTLDDLAPALASGLEARISGAIEGFISSPAFRERVPPLVERAHAGTIALLRGDMDQIPNVYVSGGEVVLNTIPLIAEVIRRILPDLSQLGFDVELPDRVSDRASEARGQLEAALKRQLPEDFGQVPLMSEAQLDELQGLVVTVDRLVVAVVIVTVLLLIAAFVVSTNRWVTALQLGLGVVLALLLAAWYARRAQQQMLAAITDPDRATVAAGVIADIFGGLKTVLAVLLIVGVVAAVAGWLFGRNDRPEQPAL